MRKQLIATLLFILSLAGVAHATPPNFVVIMTDDQRADSIWAMPAVQQLASTGTKFTNAFVTTSLCCPSRASFLTGNSAHYHGVLDNRFPNGGATLFDHTYTIASVLKWAGYRTGLYGKYLNEYWAMAPMVPPSWDEWHVFKEDAFVYTDFTLVENGIEVPYTNTYSTDLLRDKTLNFIQTSTEPFFVIYAPFAPHAPSVPAPRHVGAFANWGPYRPPSYKEADISEKPGYLTRIRNTFWTPAYEQQIDDFQRNQLETLLSVDEAIAAIVAASPPNTIFIFTSDNGVSWGEHWSGFSDKRFAYDEHIRVPLVISGPGVVPHIENRIALNIDLKPTIMKLAGLVPEGEGRSLHNVLKNLATPAWRTDFLAEGWNFQSVYFAPTYTAVVSKDWKYIRSVTFTGDLEKEELYNLTLDPYEMTDLKATYPTKLDEMRARHDVLTSYSN